jgi:TP901 family phage tail tape measure protein
VPVYLDVESRLDRAAVGATVREITSIFDRLGADVSRGLGGALGRAFSAFDGTRARAELAELGAAWRRAADIEVDAARRMEVAALRASEATAKYGPDSAKAMQAQAMAARSQRDYVDALAANEVAHKAHTKAMQESAATATLAGRAFNAAGVGALAVYTGSILESIKAAGNFQASQVRLVASAGESSSALKTVSDGILQMAGQVGYSAQELSNGMYTVEKAGYRGADGLKVLQSAAELAKAENADLGEVLNGLTTSMNDYNIPVSQAADVASKLNVAVALAKTNLQEFSGALHNVEPVAMIGHVGLEQVYGDLARLTQSGMSPDQGAQNLAQTIRNFMGPNQQMRDALGKLGLSAHELQVELADPSVGLNGVLKQVSERIRSLAGPDGQVAVDAFYKNVDAAGALKTAYGALSPQAKSVADQLNAGTITLRELRTQAAIDPALKQWVTMRTTVDGLSSNLKKLQPDLETVQQLFKEATGGSETLNVLAQLYGTPEDAQKTADAVKKIGDAHADAQGKVQGFTETQTTLNAKMADAKAAFETAAIEIGTSFVPPMTDAAHVAQKVGEFMAKHPAIMHDAVDALGLLGGAWLTFKAINVVENVLAPIVSGLGKIIDAEEGAEAATAVLGRALSGLKVGAVAGVAAQLGGQYAQDHTSGAWHSAAVVGTDAGTGAAVGAGIGSIFPGPGTAIGAGVGALIGGGMGIYNQIENHAGGGALNAPGPKGTDSALFWGARGEHVLTADDVDAAGGHGAVYAWRASLHRQDGGPIGADDPMSRLYSEAEALNGANYVWGSTDCSGAVSLLVDAALGTSGRMNTGNAAQWLSAKGFQPGYQPGAFNVGWYNGGPGGGHMAATLPDGTHFESGGQHGGIELGGSAAGAESSEFTDHMYLPVQGLYPDGPAGGGGGSRAVAAASDRLIRAQERLSEAKQREAEVEGNPKSKQSARTKAIDEVADAERQVAAAERERAAAIRQESSGGGGGHRGNPFLPVSLPDRFGLSKGLPGLAEWVVGFMEDMVLGPLETGAMAALGMSPGGQSGGLLGMMSDGAPRPGDFGFGAPAAGAVDLAAARGGPGVEGPSGGYSGGVAAESQSSSAGGPGRGDGWRGMVNGASAPAGPASPPANGGDTAATPNIGAPFPLPTNPEEWANPPVSGEQSPWLLGLLGPQIAGPSPLPGARAPQSFPSLLNSRPGAPAPDIWGLLGPMTAGQLPNSTPSDAPVIGRSSIFDPAQNPLLGGNPLHFSTGGPSGTDTIPAWLSPGEEVERASAVQKYGQSFMDRLNQGRVDPAVRYFDVGGPTSPQTPPPPAPPPAPAPAPAPKALAGPAPHPGSPPAPKALAGPAPSPKEAVPTTPTLGGANTRQGLQKPGASEETFGQGLPASSGIGFGGGILGAAEGAASQAAGMASFGAGGNATQLMFQVLNRTAAYGAQVAGIGVEALLETFLPADSPLSNFSNTLPGKLLAGVAGVRPASPSSAGRTQAPLTAHETAGRRSGGGGDTHLNVAGDLNVHPHNFADMANQAVDQASRSSYRNYATARATNTP